MPSTQVQIGEEPEADGNSNEIIDERAQKRMKLSSENDKSEQSLVEEEKQPEPPAQVYTSARESIGWIRRGSVCITVKAADGYEEIGEFSICAFR